MGPEEQGDQGRSDSEKVERIIFIPGIKTYDWYLKGWKRDLRAAFPDREVVFLDHVFYLHFQHEKLARIVEQGMELMVDGRPTAMLGHSFGGMLAKAILYRLYLKGRSKHIVRLLTMGTPHTMSMLGVKSAREFLDIPTVFPEEPQSSIVTFGGYLDPVVPFPFTAMESSKHENLWVEHLSFLLFSRIRHRMIDALEIPN